MKQKPGYFQESPLGLVLSNIAKQYFGVLSKRLGHLELERYYTTLVVIDRFGLITQQQLADLICKDKVAIVRVVDYLSKKGYVKRKKDKQDRRKYYLELTEKARKDLPEISAGLSFSNESAFKEISQSEIEVFHKVLEKIAGNLSALPSYSVDLNYRRIKK